MVVFLLLSPQVELSALYTGWQLWKPHLLQGPTPRHSDILALNQQWIQDTLGMLRILEVVTPLTKIRSNLQIASLILHLQFFLPFIWVGLIW